MYFLKLMTMALLGVLGPFEFARTMFKGTFQMPRIDGWSGIMVVQDNLIVYSGYIGALMFFSAIFVALLVTSIVDHLEHNRKQRELTRKDGYGRRQLGRVAQ
ncbi:MAG: hypothetical protein AAGE61_04155 [Pseudomonadota bacterium]